MNISSFNDSKTNQPEGNALLNKLQHKQWLWRGFQTQHHEGTISSGYPELDKKLAGGFPKQGVIELKTLNGIGEIRAVVPYLRALQHQGIIVLIAPPAHISSEFLVQSGIDVNRILLLTPKEEKEALWCAEQCLKSGCSASVLLWLQTLEIHQVRRLNLASEKGQASLLLFRLPTAASFTLPVSLSIRFLPLSYGLKVAIDKRKGGKNHQEFIIRMNQHWPDLALPNKANNVVELMQNSKAIGLQ